MPPDDAPPAYASVARVFRSATEDPTDRELAGEAQAVEQFRRAFAQGAGTNRRPMRRPVAAGGLVAAVLVAGAVSAAAAGVLPAPVQRLAHTAFAHAGISIPTAAADHSKHEAPTTTTTVQPTCNSSAAGSCAGQPASPGATVCTVASDGTCRNHGTVVCTAASDGTCRDNHGVVTCTAASNGACHAGSPPGQSGESSAPSTTETSTPASAHPHTGPPVSTPGAGGQGGNGHPTPPPKSATTTEAPTSIAHGPTTNVHP